MKQTTDQRANEKNDDFLLSSSIISKTKGNGTRSTVNDQSKSREKDIDLILMNNNKTQMKNASDDKRTDKDSKPSTKRIIGIYDDLFLPEKVHTEDYKNEDEDESHGDDEAPKKISQESSPRNINEDDDFDEIPTIDSLHSSTNDKCEIIYDFNLRIAQLPSLQELDAKINRIQRKRQDGIDLTPLINQLIPDNYFVEERDELWTPDYLLNDIKNHFRQSDEE